MREDAVVLALRNVTKSYGGQPALRGLDLEVAAGEFVGVLGANGAGKSTLFQIIAGLFRQDEGEAELFGMTHGKDSPRILRRVGVVFQSRSIDLDMTVEGNLRFHGGLFGLWGSELRNRIERVTEQLGIADKRKRQARAMSGGEQRRVEVARALLNDPDLLLMDEPTAGLDPTSRQSLVQRMQALARDEGTAILWATHLLDELLGADRIAMIRKGRVVAVGRPEEIIETAGAEDLVSAYTAINAAED